MNSLFIEATHCSPLVSFDSSSGIMKIVGRSIPESKDDFWSPILFWFENYIQLPADHTEFIIDLDYLDITSSKRILFLLYKLNKMANDSKSVKVLWHYKANDEDMFEVGQDYKYMVKVPFEFVVCEEEDNFTSLQSQL